MKLSDIKVSEKDLVDFTNYQKTLFFSKIDGGYPVGIMDSRKVQHHEDIKKIFKEKLAKETTEITELARRTLHYVYRVKTGDGAYIIRINAASMFYKELQFYIELFAMEELEKRNITHLKIYDIDTSRSLVDYDFEIMDVVSGDSVRDLSGKEAVPPALFEKIGVYMAGVHTIQTSGYGPFNIEKILKGQGVGVHEEWGEYLTINVDKHLEYTVMAELLTVAEADAVKDVLAILAGLQVEQPVFLHGSIANRNIFSQNGEVSGVIDWEDGVSGDPVFDLSFFGAGCYGHEEWYVSFMEGYKKVSSLPDDYEKRFWAYYLRVSIAKAITRIRFKTVKDMVLPDVKGRILFGLSKLSALVL
ncbi:aminoglycoside phosphotransferase family protein [Patescibacteria group bacterium]